MKQNMMLLLRRLGILLICLLVVAFLVTAVMSLFRDQFGSMILALVMGAFGSSVSLARRAPSLSRSDLASLVVSWWNLITPILIGFIMGGVLYIVFFAEILTGDGGGGLFTSNLFPSFSSPTDESQPMSFQTLLGIRPASIQDVGKLLVWCFLSGYSERLVPGLLENLEKRVGPQEA